MRLDIKFVFPELPRRTKQIRNENSRDHRAVKTNFAACPCPLWVKAVRLPGLADGEDVADWIPRVVVIGSGTKTEKPSVASYSLVEAAVVIDLNSIVDAPSEDDSELITAKD